MHDKKINSQYLPYQSIQGSLDARIFLTCEHASAYLPSPWKLTERDEHLNNTHWIFDIGVAPITASLASALKAPAILCQFSRIIIDSNRDTQADDLIVKYADEKIVHLNQNIDRAEYEKRVQNLYQPYHHAMHRLLNQYPNIALLLSMHTFTPIWQGKKRPMEMGILFYQETELVRRLYQYLSDRNIKTALNQPYSGIKGMFTGKKHGTERGLNLLALEIRQDLAVNSVWRDQLIGYLQSVLKKF